MEQQLNMKILDTFLEHPTHFVEKIVYRLGLFFEFILCFLRVAKLLPSPVLSANGMASDAGQDDSRYKEVSHHDDCSEQEGGGPGKK